MRVKRNILMTKVFTFMLILCVIFVFLQGILTPKWLYGEGLFGGASQGETSRYQTFYQLEKNSLDYITVGNSLTYYSINPSLIYAETGYRGYNVGVARQGIGLAYYWAEEALKYQSPKYLFWDANLLLSESAIDSNDGDETVTINKAFAYMKFGTTKIKASIDIAGQTDKMNWIQILFPMASFHTRWKYLTKDDFSYSNDDYALMGAFLPFRQRNYSDILDKNKDEYLAFNLKGEVGKFEKQISDKNKQYFEKMLELCNKNQTKLIPFFAQETFVTTDDGRNTIIHFLEEYDLDCLTFDNEDLGINWDIDTADTGTHLNYWGSCKYSSKLASWMQEQEEIRDYSNASVKEHWDNNLELYKKFEENKLVDSQEQVLSYFHTLEANKDNLFIIISVRDEACDAFNEELQGYVKRLGLQGQFNEEHIQNSYIAIIDEGTVVFERWEAAPMLLEDKYMDCSGNEIDLQISSGGYVFGDEAEIIIGDIDFALNKRGLNIVALDNKSGKVISSVAIDTHMDGMPFYSKTLDEDVAKIWDQYAEQSLVLEEGIYMIHPYETPEYTLDISNGSWEDNANLQLWDSTGEKPQQFALYYEGDGLYSIQSVGSGKYLTAYRYGNTNTTNVVQDSYTGLANQKWYIYRDSRGAYCLMSHYNKLVMDVAGTKSGAGVNIFLHEPVHGEWQSFEFEKVAIP